MSVKLNLWLGSVVQCEFGLLFADIILTPFDIAGFGLSLLALEIIRTKFSRQS